MIPEDRKEITNMEDVILQVNHLSKSFGSHEVLRDIDFTVNKGDVTSIIGASGSGKSTLLRCINLLETPTSGEVCYHGRNVAGRGINAPAYRAHVGMVFQSFNLFNNMTVLENCGLTVPDSGITYSRNDSFLEFSVQLPQPGALH